MSVVSCSSADVTLFDIDGDTALDYMLVASHELDTDRTRLCEPCLELTMQTPALSVQPYRWEGFEAYICIRRIRKKIP